MCGICGQLNFKNKALYKNVLHCMCQQMVHRGPNDEGYYVNGIVGLGIRRLSIIDIAGGHQPIANETKTVWIVYNGELYNYQTLKKELITKGHVFRTGTDTEAVIHAYEEWDVNCLERFNGMFGFAIWDETKKRLFLARDRLGIKPLYYYKDKERFLFASEVRALLASRQISLELSKPGLASYLMFGGVQEPLTLINNVYSLMPGSFLILSQDKITIKSYWQMIPTTDIGDKSESDRQNQPVGFQERLGELIEDAVRLQMISDVPLGAFLSGGIDSSAIVAIMSRLTNAPIKTVTLAFEEQDFDESSYAQQITNIFETEHHRVIITEKELLSILPAAVKAMDQPTVDGVNSYFVSRAAREAGLKVALSGLGGDEIFAGYESFRAVPIMEQFCRWEKKLPRFVKKSLAYHYARLSPESDRHAKIAHLLSNGFDGLGHSYYLMRAYFTSDNLANLLDDVANFWDQPPFSEYHHQLLSQAKKLDAVNQVSLFELSTYMKNILLRDMDFMSMAHSLEVRVPLIDYRLVELLFSIPGSHKLNGALSKHLLWQNLKEQLPQSIVSRKKQGFVLPFAQWMRQQLNTEVKQTLLSNTSKLNDSLNQNQVEKLWQKFERGHTSWHRAWILYTLKKWVANNL